MTIKPSDITLSVVVFLNYIVVYNTNHPALLCIAVVLFSFVTHMHGYCLGIDYGKRSARREANQNA